MAFQIEYRLSDKKAIFRWDLSSMGGCIEKIDFDTKELVERFFLLSSSSFPSPIPSSVLDFAASSNASLNISWAVFAENTLGGYFFAYSPSSNYGLKTIVNEDLILTASSVVAKIDSLGTDTPIELSYMFENTGENIESFFEKTDSSSLYDNLVTLLAENQTSRFSLVPRASDCLARIMVS